ncbi:DUF1360 domain-containing protein [Streptomyces andamanensis]|uniref:DUF1360 domain-containing protein n=1 Tax=Streptomyces andamanensis TaxID=1565035 RepID=A0ABV8TCG6_9ACTN
MEWLSVFISALTVLAHARVTRIVTEDTITQPIRNWIDMKAQPRHKRPAARPAGRPGASSNDPQPAPRPWRYLSKLVSCPWCSGFWIALILAAAYYRFWLHVWPWQTSTLAFAFVVSWLSLAWVSSVLTDWLDSPPPPKQLIHSGHVQNVIQNVQATNNTPPQS